MIETAADKFTGEVVLSEKRGDFGGKRRRTNGRVLMFVVVWWETVEAEINVNH